MKKWKIAGAVLLGVTVVLVMRNQVRVYLNHRESARVELVELEQREAPRRLLEEVQPVALRNCRLERFGEEHDGGYLMCANLLNDVQSGYSYGISGYDEWGCDISTRRSIAVHQYQTASTWLVPRARAASPSSTKSASATRGRPRRAVSLTRSPAKSRKTATLANTSS